VHCSICALFSAKTLNSILLLFKFSESEKLPFARNVTWNEVVNHAEFLLGKAKLGVQMRMFLSSYVVPMVVVCVVLVTLLLLLLVCCSC
jgi:hypothetical protein